MTRNEFVRLLVLNEICDDFENVDQVILRHFETYFYVTKAGMDVQLSRETWWPFDDDDNLRSDWQLNPPQL